MEHHLAGRIPEAEAIYRQILSTDPQNPDALHRLGVLEMQKGEHASAVELIGQAVKLNPQAAHFHASLGQALSASGRATDAVAVFEQALVIRPDLVEALYGLGVTLQHLQQRDRAAEIYRRLLKINPDSCDAHNNLGNVLYASGKIAEAAEHYRRAIEIDPDRPEAFGNLGIALGALNRMDESIAMLEQAARREPVSPAVCNNLGNALKARHRYDEAIVYLRRALEIKPDFAVAFYNLGNTFMAKGDYSKAVEMFRRAVELDPNYVDAFNNLGNSLQAVREYSAAAEAYLAALRIKPDFYVAYNNLGNALRTMSKTDEAIVAIQQAIRLRPDYHAAHCNLGNAMKDAGRLDNAIQSYRRAVDFQPRDSISHSNLCFTMLYHPGFDSQAILRETLRWNVLHAQPLKAEILPHANDRSIGRKLRIGYVGADFREHCQSLFTIPLFTNHDRGRFEIYCYSHVSRPDAYTDQIRAAVDEFHTTVGVLDQQMAAQIREDRVDILINLTMHMAHGRPLVFARKPAPVQVAWLAYPGTTGIAAIDYRFTDPFLDPPGADFNYSEQSIRLPETFWCYDPLSDEIDPGPPPAEKNGFVTFGCLNNFCKVTEQTLALWEPVLKQLPDSRLILLAPHGRHRAHVRDYLQTRGIDPDRIEFLEFQPRSDYLRVYQRIDIGLDTVPYNGHTTSLDSFWMGVPVITRIGPTVVGRAGWSQLNNLDLKDLAAENDEQFKQIVLDLAGDLPRLAKLRKSLRVKMKNSPLMDAKRFAGNVEAAYQQMWSGYIR